MKTKIRPRAGEGEFPKIFQVLVDAKVGLSPAITHRNENKTTLNLKYAAEVRNRP